MPAHARRRLVVLAVLEGALVALVVAVVLAALPGVAWYVGLAAGVLVGAALLLWWCRSASGRVLRALGSVPADEVRHARYSNLVDGLCLSFGVDRPDLHVLETPALNAASVDGRNGAHLICTAGLLERLDRVELEGILAHELSHIRSGESAAATLAVALIGYPLLGGRGPVGGALGGLGARLEPARERLWSWSLGPDRELDADRVAVGVTRYPPGLYRALRTIRDGGAGPADATPASIPLWIEQPIPAAGADAGRRAGSALHPPIDERIDVLGEL